MHLSFVLLASSLLPGALAATYYLTDNHVGADFLAQFTHQAISDPTHGRVNYVDQSTALAQNLTYANGNTLILRADYWSYLNSDGPGRNSVRIRSVKSYTTHVSIFDIRHMPQGCGTWPAAWETDESNWPAGGEVDIVSLDPVHSQNILSPILSCREICSSVNDQSTNVMTLHTNPGCAMPSGNRLMTGSAGSLDCEGNTGCGVAASQLNTYGKSFNANGGGYYAMERADSFIKVWFFPRNSAPDDVVSGANTVNTDTWGTPAAHFPDTDCNISSMFNKHNIIINLTFCGDWAGSVYGSSGCPSTCVDHVNNNPDAFSDAFWDIAAVRVYEHPAASPLHEIHPNSNTAKCLDVQGGVFADGTPVQIHDCNGTGAQQWEISTGSTVVRVAGTSFCLDAGDTLASGSQMKIWTCCAGVAAQAWYYTNDNRIALQNQGQCLDLTDGNSADGTIMQIRGCVANDYYQAWALS